MTGDKSISNAVSPVSAIVGRRCEPGLENPHRAIEEPDQQSGRRRAPWGTGGSIRCCAFGAPSGGPSDDGRRGSCGIVPGESVPAVSSRWFEARAAVRTCRASRLEHHAHPHLVRARRDEMRAAERRQEVLSHGGLVTSFWAPSAGITTRVAPRFVCSSGSSTVKGPLTLPGRFRIARSHDGSWGRRATSRGAKLHSRRSGQDDNGSNSSIRFPKGSST